MWNFNKVLNISGWEIIKIVKEKNKTIFHLKQRRITADCPKCKKTTKIFHGYDRVRSIKNGTILGILCVLKFKPRRFRCQNCFSVFTEVSLANYRQRVTQNHKSEVIFNLSDRSFSSGTKKYKVSYGTQKRWLNELIKDKLFDFAEEEKKDKPFVLGIDEVSFAGREMVTTIGNITDHHLKGILNSKRKDELKKILKSFSPKTRSLISEVVIDMCPLYLTAVKQVLPQTAIVVDHFHVIQDANRRIDSSRYILQDIYKKRIPQYILTKNKEDLIGQQIHYLADIIKEYPELHMFYATKERLREMYRANSKEEATKQLRLIISTLESTDDGELISWGRTLSRWSEYILNYWINKSTNGFMEGIHNKMKLIKRISFGFRNKKVFIQKIMLSVLILTVLLPQLTT
jgi:transposase